MECDEKGLAQLKEACAGYSRCLVEKRCLLDLIRMKRAGHEACEREVKMLHDIVEKIRYVERLMDVAEQCEGIGMRILLWQVLVGREDLKVVAKRENTVEADVETAIDMCLFRVMKVQEGEFSHA